MSGPLRQRIAPARARLEEYLTKLQTYFDTNQNPRSGSRDNILQLKIRIKSTVKLIDDYIKVWSETIQSIENEKEKLAEDKEHESFLKATNLIHTLELASEALDLIEFKLNCDTPLRTMALPKMTLPSFKGNRTEWHAFWQSFEIAIHKQSLPKVQKLNYLIGCLHDEALRMVSGYSIIEENYDLVVATLKDKYGGAETLLMDLNSELLLLPPANDGVKSIRETYEKIERICRQLEQLNQNLNSSSITTLIKSKFPKWILVKLINKEVEYNQSHGLAAFNTTMLRKELQSMIDTHERVTLSVNSVKPIKERKEENKRDYYSRNNNTRYEGARAFGIQVKSASTQKPAPSKSVMEKPAFTKRIIKQPNKQNESHVKKSVPASIDMKSDKPPYPCIFCEGPHWNNNCNKYETAEQRSSRIRELKRCFKCLKAGHLSNECRTGIKCKNCRGPHNALLCFKESRVDMSISNNANASAVTNSITQPMDLPSEPMAVNCVPNSNERALLMCRKVKIVADKGDVHEAIAFFDVGSEISFITKKLATKLQLISMSHGELETFVFQHEQPIRFNSPRYILDIVLDNGKLYQLIANETPNITSKLNYVHVSHNANTNN